ncbi:NIPSNAP family protein [Streptomyces sp. NPDC060209]|uniref:NIPSNAP family protein n=1 Tax=Streptomyces sp. NPDC060209 TaxID=3347073 RepID=UPI00364AE8DA
MGLPDRERGGMMREAPITSEDVSTEQRAVRYEWTTVASALVNGVRVADAVRAWAEDPGDGGRWLGGWTSENGELGRIWVLRSFADEESLLAARHAMRLGGHPLSGTGEVTGIDVASFAGLPMMPKVEVGALGPVYEIRDYTLVPGGLPGTIEGWRRALPKRDPVDPVSVVMYALDGPERIVHVWPFSGLDERVRIRRELYAEGTWPPPGAPELIDRATSAIAWPIPGSPLT